MGMVCVAISIAALLLILQPRESIPRAAWMCSLSCLGWCGLSTTLSTRTRQRLHTIFGPQVSWVLSHIALYLGVTSATLLSILLVMRCVYVGIEMVHGYPWQGARYYGFGASGLWTIVVLNAGCLLGFLHTRESRLLTVQFWASIMLALWACLLSNPFQPTKTGGFERTDSTLILIECVASIVLIWAALIGWMQDFGHSKEQLRPAGIGSGGAHIPPGFRGSVALVAMGLNIAVLYHILVPAGVSSSVLRVSGFRAGIAAATATLGCVFLLRRTWGGHLADATLGLFSLALCGLSTLAVPKGAGTLDERYPMIFNAMIVGYAASAAAFAHLTRSWGEPEHAGTIRGLMVPHLKRFAFFAAATSLLAGVMMSFWSGLPGIAAMDHSLGRVVCGLAAFLFLLLVSLRSSRLIDHLSFRYLTAATAACMVGFLLLRALPFSAELGN